MQETYKILIEIPKGTVNEKWEFDHKTGKMVLDFVFSAKGGSAYGGEDIVWPFNYGEVVGTLGGDGDALDACVFSTEPLKQGSVVYCIPFGVVVMLDRGEIDDKLFFVPANDPLAEKYKDISDFSETDRQMIKDLYAEIARQKKKIVEIKNFGTKQDALEEIKKSILK